MGVNEARKLTVVDYGAVPRNTTHTFQLTEPNSEMTGVIQPGSRDLFFAIATSNYTAPTMSPFNYIAWNASTAPSTSVWHDGPNELANGSSTPFFVAADYGPKYLYEGSAYEIVQPFITPLQGNGGHGYPHSFASTQQQHSRLNYSDEPYSITTCSVKCKGLFGDDRYVELEVNR
ncbi:hypothetical protein BT96DRAFT_979405 [Gymnopus androsaceus JB14]|uniref:Uncharacterized protein n=1 Tax=Gymnopus androsaceus JB14 TaxID=1447944 RepID=A0A6A4H2H3_9AGAR|nr:hypothetical protein BT96DRAFT_979405 [Gymnopus androsaceus JB14]